MLMEVGFYEESETILESLLDEFNEVPDVYYLLGVCYKLQKDYKSSFDFIGKALKLAEEQKEDVNFINEMKDDLKEVKKIMKELNIKEEDDDDDDDEMTDVKEGDFVSDEENDKFEFDEKE
jgi:tetratricopeptide (TPR) repeat protein